MRFEVAIHSQIHKRLRRLPKKHRRQVIDRIEELEENPRPHDSIQLKGRKNPGFRVDIGEYRILYDIDYPARVVDVRLLMHRGEGYRRHMKF